MFHVSLIDTPSKIISVGGTVAKEIMEKKKKSD